MGRFDMRSLNLNSTVNVLVSLGNDRINSVASYVRDLMRSCFLPQLRSIRALIQLWQINRQGWMVQPAVTAKPVFKTGRTWPVTG
jgi:hypothetical protein